LHLTNVKAGDIVEVDKRGRRFLAYVEDKDKYALIIAPTVKGISYTTATAREIVGHWSRRKS
jgi:hypothetical protein